MWKTILSIFFPIHCLGCNQEGSFICFNCFNKLPLNTELPSNNLLIASYYEYPLIKRIIHRYKYDFVKELAKPLGLLMIKKLNNFPNNFNKNNSILIPVPLHRKRLKWRGFNQAELLAQVISQELNIPMINNLLIRTKHTLPQVKLENSKQRKENINNAFSLEVGPKRPCLKNDSIQKRLVLNNDVPLEKGRHFKDDASGLIKNKTIILIDDISTTGATLKECTKALKPLNPKKIIGLVVAQG